MGQINGILPEAIPGLVATPGAVQELKRALGRVPPSAQSTLLSWLNLIRRGKGGSRRLLELAEAQCSSKEELGYVLLAQGIVLLHTGDIQAAIHKARLCLDLSCRLGHKQLEADALSHLSRAYETLGHKDLATAYADEASNAMGRPPEPLGYHPF
jgi:hypothetical protein